VLRILPGNTSKNLLCIRMDILEQKYSYALVMGGVLLCQRRLVNYRLLFVDWLIYTLILHRSAADNGTDAVDRQETNFARSWMLIPDVSNDTEVGSLATCVYSAFHVEADTLTKMQHEFAKICKRVCVEGRTNIFQSVLLSIFYTFCAVKKSQVSSVKPISRCNTFNVR